ncbi:MAG TPA: hypothetical protein VIG74_01385 [Alphaproteobacteria bacterium]
MSDKSYPVFKGDSTPLNLELVALAAGLTTADIDAATPATPKIGL